MEGQFWAPFEDLAESAFSFLFFLRDEKIVFCNRSARRAFETPPQITLIGAPFASCIDFERFRKDNPSVATDGLASVADDAPRLVAAIGAGGGRFNVLMKLARPQAGAANELIVAMKDVSDLQHAATALWGREQNLVKVFQTVTDGLVMIDASSRVIRFNASAERMFGISAKDVIGQPMHVLLPYDDPARHDRYVRDYARTGVSPVIGATRPITCRRANGEMFPAEISVSHTRVDGHDYYTAVLRDISERVAAEKALKRLALTDMVTGLPNRAALIAAIEARLAAGAPAPLAQIDLDNFRWVNDSYGHEIGDAVLRAIGGALGRAMAPGDLVTHPGGDEFVILLEGDGAAIDARIAAAFQAVRGGVSVAGYDIHVGASAGAAIGPEDGATPVDLLRNLEAAVYAAKDAGRDAARRYDAAIADHQARSRNIVADLRAAIANGEIAVHYQPKARLSDGGVIGMEALARWRHPQRGAIPPDLFIGAAERANLISTLGAQVLAASIADVARWNAAGAAPPLKVAVNLSPRQFHDFSLPAKIAGLLAEHALDPGHLELEITESGLMTDVDGVIEALRRLKAVGVSIAVDDFGTGYSSLAYLRKFPIDVLKIDRSFTLGTPEDGGAAALARSIVQMAHSLNLAVVVEGVETQAQEGFFRDLRCEIGQGWRFGKPVDRDGFERAFVSGRAAPA